MGEFFPGYEASQRDGVGVPKSTPADIVDKLNKEINAGLADPKIKAKLTDLSGTAFGSSAADFGKLIAEDTSKWATVIRAANIKVESAGPATFHYVPLGERDSINGREPASLLRCIISSVRESGSGHTRKNSG